MNEANVPKNRKSHDHRPAFPKRSRSRDSMKSSDRGFAQKEAHSRKAKAEPSSPEPTQQHPASVPGWQSIEFPSVLSAAAKARPPVSREAGAKDESSQDGRSPHLQSSAPAPATSRSSSASASVSPPSPEALIALIQDTNQRNHELFRRIAELEEALEESRQALQAEVDRASDEEEETVLAPPDLATSQQVNYLLNQLEFAQQTTQRQEILIETLTEQLQASQERVEQIEREHQHLQEQAKGSTSELHQIRNQYRELQTRLQRQQRYTLQFKAALEKCLEVPPPSYEAGYAPSSTLHSPSASATTSDSPVSKSSEANPAPGSTLPFPVAPIPSFDAVGEPVFHSTDERETGEMEQTPERSQGTPEANLKPRASEALAADSTGTPIHQSLGIRMPSLFPKTAQIRPWSAADADANEADSEGSDRIPGIGDTALESSSTKAEDSSESHISASEPPQKFYNTLLELAHLDLADDLTHASPQVPVSNTLSEAPAQDVYEQRGASDGSSDSGAPSRHQTAEHSNAVPLPVPDANPTLAADTAVENVEPEALASEESHVIDMPDASKRPQVRAQVAIGSILPPDLRKEWQAWEGQVAQSSGQDSAPGDSEKVAFVGDPSRSIRSVEFPASFSIARPDLTKTQDSKLESSSLESSSDVDTAEGFGSDLQVPEDTQAQASNAEAANPEVAKDADKTDEPQSESDNSENLWRDLAHLVDASTDDILKVQQTEEFESFEESVLPHPDGEQTKAESQTIAQSRIPPFTVPKSESAKTEATLASLAKQSQQSDLMTDLWFDANPGTTLESDSEAESHGDRPSTSDHPPKEPSVTERAKESAIHPEQSDSHDASSQSVESQEHSSPSSRREAQLPRLSLHHVDDWVNQSSNQSSEESSSKQTELTQETPTKPSSEASASEQDSVSEQAAKPANWPSPLLDPARMKQSKTKTQAKTIDLPAFLR